MEESQIIDLSILPHRKGHDDLMLAIPQLMEPRVLDSYYFWISTSYPRAYRVPNNLPYLLAKLLQTWHQKLSQQENETLLRLPIGFYDEAIECITARREDQNLWLGYHGAKRPGYDIDPISPDDDFFHNVDLYPGEIKEIRVLGASFLDRLAEMIASFINASETDSI